MSPNDFVADASAVLAALKREPFHHFDPQNLVETAISAVNFAEVLQKFIADDLTESQAESAVGSLDLRVFDFDRKQAQIAASLWTITRHLGLSLGARACLTLGRSLGRTVVTADRAWARLDLGVEILLIR